MVAKPCQQSLAWTGNACQLRGAQSGAHRRGARRKLLGVPSVFDQSGVRALSPGSRRRTLGQRIAKVFEP
jgi:hypothetical protein